MKVLLLGATGNLGSRCLPALLAHKHQVVVFVRSEKKLRDLIPESLLSEITIVRGSATDSNAVKDALVTNGCDALVNSAGLAAVFPWQAPKMQEIIEAVATASVEASKQLHHPIRAWFLGGMGACDLPGSPGTMMMSYVPIFTEHALSHTRLKSTPHENLQWSLLCPSDMHARSKTIDPIVSPRENPLIASADSPPAWKPSYFHKIYFIGTLFGVLGNAMKYSTYLEDVADFIALDLEETNVNFIGHRVGLYDTGKGKVT